MKKQFLTLALLATVALGSAFVSNANSKRVVNFDGFLISTSACANGALVQDPSECGTTDEGNGRCTITTPSGLANAVNSNSGTCPGAPLWIKN